MHLELFAYISGDFHEGTNDDILSPMFRDLVAVKAAWNGLVEANKKNIYYSLNGFKADSIESMEREYTDATILEEGYHEREAEDDGGRAESRSSFLARMQENLYKVKRVGKVAVGYRPARAIDKSYAAEVAKRELNALGIPTFYHNGLEWNAEGKTRKDAGETACLHLAA